MKGYLYLILFFLFLFLVALESQKARASGLLIADGGFGGLLEIKEQDVRVTINNGVAVTEIHQVFLNTESRVVEALYTFPVPKGASVSNFSMIINGKEMIGEVVEKKRAREIYESYKSTRTDPGLLEQVDYKRFEMRVFPIAANAEQHIKVTYYQQLDFDHDWATYVYPLATSTRGPTTSEKTTGKFALTLDIKSQIPIAEIVSPSHRDDFVIANHTGSYSRASLETTEGDLSRDVVVSYRTERPHTGVDVITSKTADEDGYFLMTLTAGKELEDAGGAMDYVFVVDISGSMANDRKLTLSRSAAEAFMQSLGNEDRMEVLTFNINPNAMLNQLENASEELKEEAAEFLLSQRARGGTSLRPAVLTSYKYKDTDRPLNVVILSDGMTEQREQRQLLELIDEAPSGTRVFCVGIGNEVNRPLLKQLADEAGGLATFISHGDDFGRQAEAFRRKLVRPVGSNLQINIDGLETYDVLPGELPNLYYGTPVRMIGRYRGSGPVSLNVSGEIMGQPFEQKIDVEFPDRDDSNPEIDRMWAWYQVQRLQNEMRRVGERPELTSQIVELCEGYSIVSEYASFIVLENDAEYRRWKIQRRNATRIQRDRAAREALREELDELREESLSQLGPQTETQNVSTRNKTQQAPSSSSSSASRPSPGNGNQDLRWSPDSGGTPGVGGGGGAIDPITGLIGIGLAGASALGARKRRRSKRDSERSGPESRD